MEIFHPKRFEDLVPEGLEKEYRGHHEGEAGPPPVPPLRTGVPWGAKECFDWYVREVVGRLRGINEALADVARGGADARERYERAVSDYEMFLESRPFGIEPSVIRVVPDPASGAHFVRSVRVEGTIPASAAREGSSSSSSSTGVFP